MNISNVKTCRILLYNIRSSLHNIVMILSHFIGPAEKTHGTSSADKIIPSVGIELPQMTGKCY